MQIEVLDSAGESEVRGVARLMAQLTKNPPADVSGPLETIVQAPDCDVIVAREGAEILGMVVVNVVHKVSGREGRIDEVVVDEAHRGRGIATGLMERAVDELRNRGCAFVEFTSSARREAANKLYQSLGFELRETNVYRHKL
jgi:ribosomal protein S18 acetylase RimI-like enzyme